MRRTVPHENRRFVFCRHNLGRDSGKTAYDVIIFRTVAAEKNRLADSKHGKTRIEWLRFFENLIFILFARRQKSRLHIDFSYPLAAQLCQTFFQRRHLYA